MEFILSLFLMGALQLDTCKDESVGKYLYVNAPKFKEQAFESRLDQLLFEKINSAYDRYIDDNYFGFIKQKSLSDSILLLHYYAEYEIIRSIVFDFKSNQVLGLKYNEGIVSVCELDALIDIKFTSDAIKNIFSLKESVHNPYHGIVNYENGFDIYAVHVIQPEREQLYYVCPEGLPRYHFIGDSYDLKESSEWYLVKELFGSF